MNGLFCHYVLALFGSGIYLCSKVYFISSSYTHFSFLLIHVCKMCLFPPFYSYFSYVIVLKMSFSETTCSWVIHSVSHCLLISVFRSFTFNVIMAVLEPTILMLFAPSDFCLLCSSFLNSCRSVEHFLVFPVE